MGTISGSTYHGIEQPVTLVTTVGQPAQERFYTFTYQAWREQGAVVGINTFVTDVTEQVLARQQQAQRRQLQSVFE